MIIGEKMIECKDTAYKTYINKLQKRGFTVKIIANVNKSRHKIIETSKEGIIERHYLIYKRAWYNTFNKEFKDFILRNSIFHDCLGESINQESIDVALANTCDFIVFCHPEGFFIGHTLMIKKFCFKHDLIRNQDKLNNYKVYGGSKETISEVTYSFPKNLLTELKDEI